ncbi:sodium channel protein type 4 subunit alpha A-like, partial [Clarias magur]
MHARLRAPALRKQGEPCEGCSSGKGKTPKRVSGRAPDRPLSDDPVDTDGEDGDILDNEGPDERSRPKPQQENTVFVFSMGPKGPKILPPS